MFRETDHLPDHDAIVADFQHILAKIAFFVIAKDLQVFFGGILL